MLCQTALNNEDMLIMFSELGSVLGEVSHGRHENCTQKFGRKTWRDEITRKTQA